MKFKNVVTAISLFCTLSLFAEESSQGKFSQLKEELGLSQVQTVSDENRCHLYIVHHGDTEYTAEGRLQGWIDPSLSDEGREQMQELAMKLSTVKIDAIYSSSLARAQESAQILSETLQLPVIVMPELRGESHGNLEGMLKAEYQQDPHYLQYKSLSSEEKIFFSVGEEGLSKADVARQAIPALKEICLKHPGENVVIVTHGGVLKFIHFLLGNYTPEQIEEVPHGEMLRIEGDGSALAITSEANQ
ncbi:MAG: histidine phosphatase family protein [Chlamydiota bacterium]